MKKQMGMAVLAIVSLGPVMAAEPGSLAGAFSATKPIFDARLRTEDVDQEGIANDANAITLRAHLGFETGDICKELAITPTHCWVLLYRARMALRQCLETSWLGK